ncbi:MAG: hypothetical protein HY846_01085 [Nitrosomonadales bacterium]|nr:hypothetical protein [Nitrosomonadales bacterium]
MKKVSNTCISAVLLLFLCMGLTPCSYGHSLVFGPEVYFSDSGKSRREVKKFTVEDINQKFIISVQVHAGGESKAGSIVIKLNGKPIFSANELGKQQKTLAQLIKLLAKPVKLQKRNEISVETASESDEPVIVTIMSLEERAIAGKVPPIGEAVDLDGYATVIFPSGTFDSTQDVRVFVTASPAIQDVFQANATGARLPYEIRINTGDKPPKKDIEVSVKYPDSFFATLYQIHIFAHMHDNPDVPDEHDRFFMLSSGLDDKVNMAMTTLPKHAFSNRNGKKGTYEAIITVGLIN